MSRVRISSPAPQGTARISHRSGQFSFNTTRCSCSPAAASVGRATHRGSAGAADQPIPLTLKLSTLLLQLRDAFAQLLKLILLIIQLRDVTLIKAGRLIKLSHVGSDAALLLEDRTAPPLNLSQLPLNLSQLPGGIRELLQQLLRFLIQQLVLQYQQHVIKPHAAQRDPA